DGNYKIKSTKKSDILDFTAVGFVSREAKISGQNRIDVVLTDDPKSLQDVVVIQGNRF
ncbi:MAG: hypothetical protein H7325_01440, partial [Pedobacter sp.]|nr:hypothetical protein [Pedobacter sp.]